MNNYSTMWRMNVGRLNRLPLDRIGLRIVQANRQLFTSTTVDRNEQFAAADGWENFLDRTFPGWRGLSIEESDHVSNDLCFLSKGRRVSTDFYRKLYFALEILKHQPKTIVEIGGGYGHLAYVVHRLCPQIPYTIIDLPESLQWSQLFLQLNQVEAKFIEPRAFETVGSCDCLVNTSSMGEMPIEAARGYLAHFSGRRVHYSVLLNRLLNTYCPWREAARLNEAGWYFYVDREAKVLTWDLEPEFTRIEGVDSYGGHREVLMVLDHAQAAEPPVALSTIDEQYWWKHRNRCPSDRAANILWPDKRTLRMLLEGVRIQPSKQRISRLLYYLKCIRLRYPFEEEAVLKRMLGQRVIHPLQWATSWLARCKWNTTYAIKDKYAFPNS